MSNFPAIKSHRLTKKLIYQKKKIEEVPDNPIEKKALLAVTFDDGIKTDIEIAHPYMTARGVKGTTYVVGSAAGRGDYMDWSQIAYLNNDPMWEIGSHTYYHYNSSEMTEAELIDDWTKQKQVFEENGLSLPGSLAYPFGGHNTISHSVYDDVYQNSRITSYRYYESNLYETFDENRIKSVYADTNDEIKLQFVKDAIDYAISNKGLLTIYLHRITEEPTEVVSWTAREYFEQIIDYVVSTGIETVTISEMVDYALLYQSHL